MWPTKHTWIAKVCQSSCLGFLKSARLLCLVIPDLHMSVNMILSTKLSLVYFLPWWSIPLSQQLRNCKATWGPFRPFLALHTKFLSLTGTLMEGIPDSHPWPLEFPVMAACHPCSLEQWWWGFKFHTVTAAPHTQTDTFSPSWNTPCSPTYAGLCLAL